MNEEIVQAIMATVRESTKDSGLTDAALEKVEAGVRSYVSVRCFSILEDWDVLDRASSLGIPMSRKEALSILGYIEEKQDFNRGITFEELESKIEDWYDKQAWMHKTISELREYETATYIMRAGSEDEGEYRVLFDVMLDFAAFQASEWFANFGNTVTVVCVPYGEHQDLDLDTEFKSKMGREWITQLFKDSKEIFEFKENPS